MRSLDESAFLLVVLFATPNATGLPRQASAGEPDEVHAVETSQSPSAAHVVHLGLARGSMGWARVHVGAENRTTAEKLCTNLRAAGWHTHRS
jgi:hypothetical protein